MNAAGAGEWSQTSHTAAVAPMRPEPPTAPVPVKTTLTSLTFQWTVPNDGGAAVDAYRLEMSHRPNRPLLLRRHQTSYTLDGLSPGQTFRIRVQARNCSGWSDYSELSTPGTTAVAPPTTPPAPVPIDGDSASLLFEFDAPESRGCALTSMLLQTRIISPFQTSEWSPEKYFSIPGDAEILPVHDLKASDVASTKVTFQYLLRV